jgi:NADP-dependent 3-hydroxy acid dehydrogenase YdfG
MARASGNGSDRTQRIALVTGASSGIGKAAALALIRDGFTVYGAARRIEKMSELEATGGIPIKIDITVDTDIAEVIGRIHRDHGHIDVLVINAGYAAFGAVEDVSIDDARRQFDVNLFGLARLTQLALPNMRAHRSGRVINISSVGGKVFTPLGASYHATKHALEGLPRS